MNPLSKILCTCAGANLKLIGKYPLEVSRYNSIGATIVFTGIFATLSGGYAFYKIFDNYAVAIVLGIIWGAMIFNLDRYIVMSIKKENNFFKELFTSLPRIVLALIISIVIAKPIEVRIFADRLMSEISDREVAKMKENRDQINAIFGVSESEEKVESVKNEIEVTEAKKSVEPTTKRFTDLKNEKLVYERDLERKVTELRTVQAKVSSFFNRYTYTTEVDGVSVVKVANRSSHLPAGAWNKIKGTVITRDNLKKETTSLRNRISDTELAISNEREAYYNDVNNKINTLKIEKTFSDSTNAAANSKFYEKAKKLDSINAISYSNNFVTQIQALGSLTKYKKPVYDENGEITEPIDNTLFWMNIAIIVLFIVIETAPIFVKLISGRGQYDIAMEAEYSEKESNTISSSNLNILKDEQDEGFKVEIIEKDHAVRLEILESFLESWKENMLNGIKNVNTSQEYQDALQEVLAFNVFGESKS